MKRPSLSKRGVVHGPFFIWVEIMPVHVSTFLLKSGRCQLWETLNMKSELVLPKSSAVGIKVCFFSTQNFFSRYVHSSSLNSNRIEHGVWYQFVMLPSYSSSLLELCATATTIIRYWPFFFQSCFMLNCVPDWWVWILFWVTIFFYFNRVYTWWFLFQRGAKWSSSEQ